MMNMPQALGGSHDRRSARSGAKSFGLSPGLPGGPQFGKPCWALMLVLTPCQYGCNTSLVAVMGSAKQFLLLL